MALFDAGIVTSFTKVFRFTTGPLGRAVHSPAFNDVVCCNTNHEDGTVHDIETFPLVSAICKTGVGVEECV